MIAFLVTQIVGSSPVLINHNMFLLKRFGFLQFISLNMVLQVKFLDFGQVNIILMRNLVNLSFKFLIFISNVRFDEGTQATPLEILVV